MLSRKPMCYTKTCQTLPGVERWLFRNVKKRPMPCLKAVLVAEILFFFLRVRSDKICKVHILMLYLYAKTSQPIQKKAAVFAPQARLNAENSSYRYIGKETYSVGQLVFFDTGKLTNGFQKRQRKRFL